MILNENQRHVLDRVRIFVENANRLPKRDELIESGLKRAELDSAFGSYGDLIDYVEENYGDFLDQHIKEDEKVNDEIIQTYKDHVEEYGRKPPKSAFKVAGHSDKKIRHWFGNITLLHQYMEDNHKDFLNEHLCDERTIFTPKKLQTLEGDIAKCNRFVITAAIAGKPTHMAFYNTLKDFCRQYGYKLLLQPCHDVNSVSSDGGVTYDKALKNESFIFQDTSLNNNLYASNMRLLASQINPTTGAARLGQRNHSVILASPKQFLEFVSTQNDQTSYPHAIMTAGTLSLPDYESRTHLTDKRAYMAKHDHVLGALIVEIKDDDEFHFRQIQAEDDGSFIDLGKKYSIKNYMYDSSNGYTGAFEYEKVDTHLVLGDLHVGEHDPIAFKTTVRMFRELNVKDIFIHDLFNGKSISHYDRKVPGKMAQKYMRGEHSLEDEITNVAKVLKFFLDQIHGTIYIVKSNHDEWLERYLMEGAYAKDPTNHRYAVELVPPLLDEKDPLRYAVDRSGLFEPKDLERIVWLQRDESYQIGGVEMAAHGDLGSNGSRGSPGSLEKAYGQCVTGHTHSAHIMRGAWRVGTLTLKNLDYNRGPSNWTHSNCVIYDNGSRQMLNIINGNYRAKSK